MNLFSQAMNQLKRNSVYDGLMKGSVELTEDQAKEIDQFFYQKYVDKSGDDLKGGRGFDMAKRSDMGIGFLVNGTYYEYFIIEKQ